MLSGLSQRARVALLGTSGAIGAFFLFGGASAGGGSGEPFDAIPRDSFLAATVNVAELRQSPLYDVLFGAARESGGEGTGRAASVLNARALGMGKLGDACGFDPLARVEQLAIGIPEEGEKGEFGVAARVSVTRDELSRCAESLAGQRGGKVEAKDVGSFVVIEDQTGAEAPSAKGRSRIGYGHGGLLVVGRGGWFDAMLAAADGTKPGVRVAEAHATIRSSLVSKNGWGAPTMVVSALLPKTLRDRLKTEMHAELSEHTGGRPDVMAGVLGVSSVGVALKTGASIDLAIELACDAEEACASVEKLILKKRLDWSKELMLRMVGLGPLLDSIDVSRQGLQIRVTAGASANAIATTLDRVLRFSASSRRHGDDPGANEDHEPAAKSSPPRQPEPARPTPSETIPAPRPSH